MNFEQMDAVVELKAYTLKVTWFESVCCIMVSLGAFGLSIAFHIALVSIYHMNSFLTSCLSYPSGNIAVTITATEKGKFTYIVYDDEVENESNPSQMLGIFEPSGHGTCYFRNGAVRLVLNPFFGVLLDKNGARKKKWLWHNLKEHVHAPPFQPITFMITKQLSIRCLSQNKTILTFNHGKHTARFNVGAKLKAVLKAKPPSGRDSHEMHLAEVRQFVNIVLDRAQNAMRLPNYPRLDKIPLPLHLQRAKNAGKKARLQASSPSSQQEKTVIVN